MISNFPVIIINVSSIVVAILAISHSLCIDLSMCFWTAEFALEMMIDCL